MVQSTLSSIRSVACRNEEGVDQLRVNLEAQLEDAKDDEVTMVTINAMMYLYLFNVASCPQIPTSPSLRYHKTTPTSSYHTLSNIVCI